MNNGCGRSGRRSGFGFGCGFGFFLGLGAHGHDDGEPGAVRHLDQERARRLLAWLETEEKVEEGRPAPLGAKAMLGFARGFHARPRTTNEWMAELRAGDGD